MFSYLTRAILVLIFIVACQPAIASVRPPGAPTVQQEAREQKQQINNETGSIRTPLVNSIEANKTIIELALTGALVLFTGFLAFSTWSLWTTTSNVADAAKKSAEVAFQANEFNRKTYFTKERPWVVVPKIIPQSSLDLRDGLKLSFAFVAENVGNSIAVNVDVSGMIHLPHMGNLVDVQKENRERLTREREGHVRSNVGHLLIPGEQRTFPVSIQLSKLEIEKSTTGSLQELGDLQGLIIMVYGCVSYGFLSEGTQHQTGFTFHVSRKMDPSVRNPRGRLYVFPNENISGNQVVFDPFPAGTYAD